MKVLTKEDCKKMIEETITVRHNKERLEAEEKEKSLKERINKMVDTHYSEINKIFALIESDCSCERYSRNFSDQQGLRSFLACNRKLLKKYFESLGFYVIVYEKNYGKDFVSMTINWEN